MMLVFELNCWKASKFLLHFSLLFVFDMESQTNIFFAVERNLRSQQHKLFGYLPDFITLIKELNTK